MECNLVGRKKVAVAGVFVQIIVLTHESPFNCVLNFDFNSHEYGNSGMKSALLTFHPNCVIYTTT